MISQKLTKILKENAQFNDFIRNVEDFEVLVKELNHDDLKRLSDEYPALLELKDVKIHESISSITFIKNSREVKNYVKLRKFKIYFDNSNEKILKILRS